ncbi:response regulator [Thalassotalea sp. Y01]|uniref:response regulator n=1 Tax=Thalassotalea sp. Y01 TaxID=2729613 RepID=UPI00145C6590|nr:response regulator [Thalassotalea sp. Y01]NMP14946.1 response regulator [Thalassotalea sp. Y01]
MKLIRPAFSLLVTLVFALSMALRAFAANDLPPELIDWANKHPIVNVGMDANFPPFDFVDEQGQVEGIGKMARLSLNEVLPITLQVTSQTTFDQEYKSLMRGDIDVLSICANSEERQGEVLFSKPIQTFTPILAVRQDSQVFNAKKDGKYHATLGVVKGYAAHAKAEDLVGASNVITTDNIEQGLQQVRDGKIDGFILYLYSLNYYQKNNRIAGLKPVSVEELEPFAIGYCINKNLPELKNIIDWGIDQLGAEHLSSMQRQWESQYFQEKKDTNLSGNYIAAGAAILGMFLLYMVWHVARKYTDEIARKFGTARFKSVYVLIVLLILAIMVSGMSWYLSEFRKYSQQEYDKLLSITQKSVLTNLKGWYQSRKQLTNSVSELPQFIELTEQLLLAYDRKSLENITLSNNQLDRFFRERPSTYISGRAAFLISKQGLTLYSTEKALTGLDHVIAEQRPELFEKVVNGQSQFIPSVWSKVDIDGNLSKQDQDAVVFVATPVTDIWGEVIAIMAMRFDPKGNFAASFTDVGVGDTLEAYSIDRKGRMLTQSRFLSDLYNLGQLEYGKSNILNVVLPNGEDNTMTQSALYQVDTEDIVGYRDYRGKLVVGKATWLKEMNNSVVVEVDIDEVYKRYYQLRFLFAVVTITIVIVVAALSTFMFIISQRATDITRRSQQELERIIDERTQELVASERTNRSVLGSVADGIFGIDKHGVCRIFNESASNLLGYQEEDVIDQSYYQLFHKQKPNGDSLTDDNNPILNAVREGKTIRNPMAVFEHKNGESIPVEYSVAPISDDDEHSELAAVVAFQDISERLEEKNRINTILESMPIAMLLVNTDDVIEQINATTTRMLGWATEELDGKPLHTIVPHHRRKEHQLFTQDYWQEPFVHHSGNADVPLDILTKDGGCIEVESVYTPIVLEDKSYVIVSLRDVTQENQAKKALLEAKVLADEASRAKSDFLANMSHEIRTPMNAIIGMSHLALEHELDSKPKNYIKKVHRAAESLLGIINDILDFSKIEAGKLELERIDFTIDDVMDDVANIIGFQAHDKGIELLFNISPDVPVYLSGDPLRLNQILINLANNAIKFTEVGQIVISIKLVPHHTDKVRLRFAVQDSGIGMSQQQMDKLFQSFSQADSSTTRKYGGTGLGLTICQKLIHLMQGEIWIESEVGKGSVFFFDVVLDLPQGKLEPKFSEQQRHLLTGKKVLIVDDNTIAAEVLSNIMSSFGCDIQVAYSGLQAIDLVSNGQTDFDFAMIDWQMPGLDGLDTVAKLQTLLSDQTKHFVLISAYGKDQIKNRAQLDQQLHIDSFLSKPVTASSIFDEMMRLMGQSYIATTRKLGKDEVLQQDYRKLNNAKVLLVEDNELNQELAIGLLQQAKIRYDVADNGQQAVEMAALNRYDGILMDLQMPVMDGYTAAGIIRQEQPDMPIIAMTANAMASDKEKVLSAGMNAHIAKPINVNDMFSTMAKWISSQGPFAVEPITDVGESQSTDGDDIALQQQDLSYVNIDKGLATCAGDKNLYLRLLRKFVASQSDFYIHFSEAWGEHKLNKATRLAHTLKGTAGNIGANLLQAEADKLETALNGNAGNEVISTQLQQVTSKLQDVLSELGQLLNSSKVKDNINDDRDETAIDMSQYGQQLNYLLSLIEDFETDATDVAEDLQQQFTASRYEFAFKRILTSIENYDFDNAHALLKQFISQNLAKDT